MTETPVIDRPANATEQAEEEVAPVSAEESSATEPQGDPHVSGECDCYPAKLVLSAVVNPDNPKLIDLTIELEGAFDRPATALEALGVADGMVRGGITQIRMGGSGVAHAGLHDRTRDDAEKLVRLFFGI